MELRPAARSPWPARLAAALLAAVFLYAGLVKAAASDQFLLALMPFAGLGDWLWYLSRGLPVAEILTALLLLSPLRRLGAALALALLVVFTGVLLWALASGIIVSCGCFGQDETPSAGKMLLAVLRDILLALLAAFVLWRERLSAR